MAESVDAALITDQTSPEPEADNSTAPVIKWPGWPGDNVFRVIVPALKVGSIIGRKGDVIKKICEETKARIRVLDGSDTDRIVLISGREETEAPLSPAMDAVIKVFKRVNGFPEDVDDDGVASVPCCTFRLLVPSVQATSLIGKQGSLIKRIRERSGCPVRVLSSDEVSTLPINSNDRVVNIQGDALKALKALVAVALHLRKFLVDHSVLPLFEQTHNATATQEHRVETWAEKSMVHTGSLYQDPGLCTTQSPELGPTTDRFVTQVAQTMQIPFGYAEDIIGIEGKNIAHIRQTSGAVLIVQESSPDGIIFEIKGTSSQVQVAQQLIQESVIRH